MSNILRGIGKITNSAGQTFEWELTDPTAGQGLIYQDGKWINSGNFASDTGTVSTMDPITGVEYLVIGGGGGGGADEHTTGGAGGGAGGYRSSVQGESSGENSTAESTLIIDKTYSIVIGAGGVGATSRTDDGSNGEDSIFGTITSIGGGRGAKTQNNPGYDGGSGGGGNYNGVGGTGTANQGYAGGVGQGGAVGTGNRIGGGGGGAGGAGGDSGDGGVGISSLITGTSIERAGGGGGGTWAGGTAGTASGGGAVGASPTNNNTHGFNATQNTGGGGGGASVDITETSRANGGSGGSGVVILAYPKESQELAYIDGNLAYNYSQRPSDQAHVYEFIDGAGQISATEADPAFYSKEFENACLFDGESYLSRAANEIANNSPNAPWTFSAWVKRSDLASSASIFAAYGRVSNFWQPEVLMFKSSTDTSNPNCLHAWLHDNGSGYKWDVKSTEMFSDSNSWYHIVFQHDNVNGILRVYVNKNLVINSSASHSYATINSSAEHLI